jgi:hypothetical protein
LKRLIRPPGSKFHKLFGGNLLVFDLLPDHLAYDRRDFRLRELDWAEKRISLSDVSFRLSEDANDEACLVLGRDRGVAARIAKRNRHISLSDHRREIEQPLCEERRLEMNCRHARPIEYALA